MEVIVVILNQPGVAKIFKTNHALERFYPLVFVIVLFEDDWIIEAFPARSAGIVELSVVDSIYVILQAGFSLSCITAQGTL